MRVLLQRVSQGSVTVDGDTLGQISLGYVLLVGVGQGDTRAEADRLAEKIVNLRLFPDDRGRFDRSLLDVVGDALVVSQFTLFGDARKGRRPSFIHAADPADAEPLVDYFAERLKALGVRHVATGRFAAMMDVEIHNDGPVTLWLDSAELSA
ncbi:D-aminoacyl-tRNA deacylase [Phycisphaerales bacterium AB-hyl4]|uniref:D-aminoacyl-tRNA deacylase n=1 Tax=Natronomicrosphaera hydrolytica TaxID=3242702 RepID=A0ABV4U7A9_9BACT